MKGETLFRALSDVGDDLLLMAQTRRFASPWKKWGSLAACIALVLCLGLVVLPYFPMGCGSSEAPMESPMEALPEDNMASQETAPEALPEAEEGDCEAPAEDTAAPTEAEKGGSFLFEGQTYVLQGEAAAEPADLGQLLGTVEDWTGGENLDGCQVYAVQDSENRYVKTETGYILAVPEA